MSMYEIIKSISITEPVSEVMIENALGAEITLDNKLLHKDIDYIILESGMVQFNTLLDETSELLVKHVLKSLNPVISLNPNRSVYQKFSTSKTLENNIKYQISLSVKDQIFQSAFYSKFSPFYLTNPITTIKHELGGMSAKFTDTNINFAIHSASKDFDDKLLINNYTDTLDTVGIRLREKWVKYKAVLDLINEIYIEKAGSVGSQKKKIGNMEVEINEKIPYYSDMIKRTAELFTAADADVDRLILGINTFGTFVKGGKTPYPLNNRVW